MTQQRGNREERRHGRRAPRNIDAEYIKSPLSRVIHVDGAYGGPTGPGFLYMALYSEHTKLPKAARFKVDEATSTARAEPIQPEASWTREVEVEAIMSLSFAKALRQWLDGRIQIMEDPDREVITVVTDEPEENDDDSDTTATSS